jgi:argininosuccinate lyase
MSKLWGGRFSKKTQPVVEKFTKSIHYDQRLLEYDCWGSLIHVNILKKAGLLSVAESTKLIKGIKEILEEYSGKKIDDKYEDIHTFVQNTLENKKGLGKIALKLHTCRSRNDQIVFDMKSYCKTKSLELSNLFFDLCKVLLNLAEENIDIQMPGYTHLQRAMPIKLSEYLLAYNEMFKSDALRLQNYEINIKLTMGAGALAGTFIESKQYNFAAKLYLSESKTIVKPTDNAIYTVSDRDFIIEFLSILSISGMHLSRLAEDFVLWSTKEFDYIDIDESFCTGSSLMPQKKNPDVMELIRGYSGRVYGNLINVLVMMKGLPLSYNRDMQLDKEPLFDSIDVIGNSLSVLKELLLNVEFKKENMQAQLNDETLYATDIADYLVREEGVPFKQAHTIIGKLISEKLKTGKPILEMELEELKKFHEGLTPNVLRKIINSKFSVDSKRSVKKK